MKDNQYIDEARFFDYSHPEVARVLNELDVNSDLTDREKAVAIYYFVRDHWAYYPYRFSLIEEDWMASNLVVRKQGHCIDKVIIMIALLRAHKIPARLGLAKVRNHIAVEQIVEKFGNDVLVPHGYIEIWLEGKWVKATPAFNKGLCDMLGVHPLEFDGTNDSLFQEYDVNGERAFMEYMEDYGAFDTVPLAFMLELLQKYYPPIQKNNVTLGEVLDLSRL